LLIKTLSIFASFCAACLFLLAANPTTENQLWQARNLGKAFYENPDTHVQAVEELKKALDLAPDSVREQINYGLALLRAGQTDAGVAELLLAQKADPRIPHTWFNLGIAYKRAGDYDKAIEQLRGMLRLVPNEPITHYNLGAVLRAKGDTQAALAEFLIAEKLNPNLAGPHFQLFTIHQRAGDHDAAAHERQLFEQAKKRDEGAAVPEDMEWSFYAELYDPPVPRASAEDEPAKYDDHEVSTGWDAAATGMALIDSEGSGHADLLVWSREDVSLFKNGSDEAEDTGLDDLRDVRSIAVGDFNNDGLADLCVITGKGAAIYRNDKGKFTKYLDIPNSAGVTKALWLDYDHDYDLDLLLFGPNPLLMRNNGNGKFEEHTASFPFVKGNALDAVSFAIQGDTAARDVLVSYAERPGVLYRDKLNGVFEAADLAAVTAGTAELAVEDFNHDGLLDLVSYAPQKYAVENKSGQFERRANAKTAIARIRADFNGDHREDYARILPDGSLHIYLNASPTQRWSTVRIEGVKNLKEAAGATVEMKSGIFYNKRIYDGVPLAFALDSHADADTIRITWPNGLIQNEVHQKGGEALKIAEAQRLSGSCPMIFAWDGQAFQFITDVLGVAPLGASSGDGNYFPVNHTENIQIPGSVLKQENGEYQIHIAEELHEVSYLDQVQLIAVDHPSDLDIYVNDKFKAPPYPEFRLFGARQKIHPLHAIDDHHKDVAAALETIDHVYPAGFAHDTAGVAELHTLTLDFGKDVAAENHDALVLNGWVDWADGSTFLGQSQNGTGLIFPYVQVKDAHGKWQTVVQDMGIPSGKPKTIVVDLDGKFLTRSRQVRIVTNLCVYWDEIFLIENSGAPQTRMTPIDADAAELHFRGFSRAIIDSTRQQPEQFVYDDVRPVSSWNPTPGLYTRYGDVQPLVTKVDDKLVIMGSGDELKLQYPAAALPTLPQGWKRDFLLRVDGWAKDADANTAFSQSVLPLPFHGMSAYPYKANEHFPDDDEHQQYIEDYLTRPALRLIRPLAQDSGWD
jgi:tetratricopeptide (TPR) repeat protein